MKKLNTLFAAGVMGICSLHAQTTLQNGVTPFYYPVKNPYILYDLLRTQQSGWIREFRTSAQAGWMKSNLLISKKDAENRFTELSYNLWNPDETKWDNLNNHHYSYVTSSGNIQERISVNEVSEEDYQYRSHQQLICTYTSGKLSGITELNYDSSNSVFEPIAERYFTYDAQGNMIGDSSFVFSIPQYRFQITYQYSAANKCIGNNFILFRNGVPDTNAVTTYTYNGDNLSGMSQYAEMDGWLQKTEEITYTYHPDNRIAKAEIHILDESDDFVPYAKFNHEYTAAGKIGYMSSYTWDGGTWTPGDSIVLNYSGTGTDTSYGYIGGAGNTWRTYPSFRFLFNDNLTTGVLQPKQPGLIQASVYPNPAGNTITVKGFSGAKANYSIFNITGKLVKSGIHEQDIDVSDLEEGIYFITLQQNGVHYSARFVKSSK